MNIPPYSKNVFQIGLVGLVVMALTVLLGADYAVADNAHPVTKAQVQEAYGKLPLSFEANQGQTDSRVKFLSRGSGYTLFLTPTEAVLSLRPSRKESLDTGLGEKVKARGLNPARTEQTQTTLLRMKLVGGNRSPQVVGREELPGKANYFIGKDPAKWRTRVPTYAKVRYDDLYPGVDLIYYGNQRQLEYDFVVAPGANPETIVLGFQGADRLEVETTGDLVLHTAAGPIRQRKPFIYQEVDGVRREIAGGYVLKDKHQVGFRVVAYDASRPLLIDPVVLFYSTYLGGSSFDEGRGIAVDASGSAHVTGLTGSADFTADCMAPCTVLDSTRDGSLNAFVAKLNATGTALVYSTYLGGSGDGGEAIAVDATGAYVTGTTCSSDFPTTGGAFDTSFNGNCDAFVTKLNPSGSALIYSTFLGGSNSDQGFGIAVDTTGNAYVTGSTSSSDFPTTAGAFDTSFNGIPDAFVTKLNPTGSAPLVYSTFLGGGALSGEQGFGIAVDSGTSAYVTGRTSSSDFPTTAGAFDTSINGSFDAFVTKLNPTGSAPLVYSTFLGGSNPDEGRGIAVDASGSAHVTGTTFSSDFPTTAGAFDTTFSSSEAFVTKLNPTGSAPLVYSTFLGGSNSDQGFGIAVDSGTSAYVTGITGSSDFPTTAGVFDSTLSSSEAFVAKLSPIGNLVYSTYLGGSGGDQGSGIAVDATGAYVTGSTSSSDFPTTSGAFQGTKAGASDAFVAKVVELPPSTPGCEVTILDNGVITAANGDRATFSGDARSSASGEPEGDQRYRDHGPAQPLTVQSINVLSIVCENSAATIFGQATIDGSGSNVYEIRVTDGGNPGVGQDTYQIMLPSVPYNSGQQTLEGGNVIIRQN